MGETFQPARPPNISVAWSRMVVYLTTGAPKRLSPAFVQMLGRAIDHGRLSARKAAKTLDMNLSQLGDLFSEHGLPVPFEL